MPDKTKHKIKNLLQKLNDEDRSTPLLPVDQDGGCRKDKQGTSGGKREGDVFRRILGGRVMVKNILKKLAPKSVARKPIPRLDTYLKFGFVITEHEVHLCPRCGDIIDAGPDYQPGYCGKCGQKVSFSGIRWKEDKELGFAERR